jgi:type IV pilus assembly protein PilV
MSTPVLPFQKNPDAGHPSERTPMDDDGFTLIEVMIGICLLSIGILAVCSMQVSGMKENATAMHYTVESTSAMDKIETILSLPYNDPQLTDTNGDGSPGSGGNLGLFNATPATADHYETDPAGRYTLYWNVADDDLVEHTKTVSVIVIWNGKGTRQSVSMQRVIPEII